MTKQVGLGKELGQRTGGVMVAEGAGIATSLGSLLLVKGLAGPERMAAAKEQVAMQVVLPILKRMDGTAKRLQTMREELVERNKTPTEKMKDAAADSVTDLMEKASLASGASANGAMERATDVFKAKTVSPEDKARKYADVLLDLAIMAPVGVLTRIWAQGKADAFFGAPNVSTKHYFYAKTPDMLANNVTLLAMNTVAKAPAQQVSKTMEKVFGGVGVPPESAKNMATYLTYVQGGNLVGNLANVAYVTAASRREHGGGTSPSR